MNTSQIKWDTASLNEDIESQPETEEPAIKWDTSSLSDIKWDTSTLASPSEQPRKVPEGFIGKAVDFSRSAAAGLIDTAGTFMSTTYEAGDAEPGLMERARKQVKNFAEAVAPKPTESEMYNWPIIKAPRSTAHSLSTMGVTAIPGALGGPVGAVATAIGGKGIIFGWEAYNDFLSDARDEFKKQGMSNEEIETNLSKIRGYGALSGGAEAGFEIASDALSGRLLGLFGSSTVKPAVKATVKELAKKYGKAFGISLIAEPSSEVGTTITQHKATEWAGLPTGNLKEEIIDTIGTSVWQTMYQFPIGAGISRRQERKAVKQVADKLGVSTDEARTIIQDTIQKDKDTVAEKPATEQLDLTKAGEVNEAAVAEMETLASEAERVEAEEAAALADVTPLMKAAKQAAKSGEVTAAERNLTRAEKLEEKRARVREKEAKKAKPAEVVETPEEMDKRIEEDVVRQAAGIVVKSVEAPKLVSKKYEWKEIQADEKSKLDEFKLWFEDKGPEPSAPTTIYRGEYTEEPTLKPGFIHGSPWLRVGASAGKFGGAEHFVSEYPASPDQLYYRGGSLAGDPLEITKVGSVRGVTWKDALVRAKQIYNSELKKRMGNESTIDYLKEHPEETDSIRESESKWAAETAFSHLQKGTFETDINNKPGIWTNKADVDIPKGHFKERPPLRHVSQVKAWDRKVARRLAKEAAISTTETLEVLKEEPSDEEIAKRKAELDARKLTQPTVKISPKGQTPLSKANALAVLKQKGLSDEDAVVFYNMRSALGDLDNVKTVEDFSDWYDKDTEPEDWAAALGEKEAPVAETETEAVETKPEPKAREKRLAKRKAAKKEVIPNAKEVKTKRKGKGQKEVEEVEEEEVEYPGSELEDTVYTSRTDAEIALLKTDDKIAKNYVIIGDKDEFYIQHKRHLPTSSSTKAVGIPTNALYKTAEETAKETLPQDDSLDSGLTRLVHDINDWFHNSDNVDELQQYADVVVRTLASLETNARDYLEMFNGDVIAYDKWVDKLNRLAGYISDISRVKLGNRVGALETSDLASGISDIFGAEDTGVMDSMRGYSEETMDFMGAQKAYEMLVELGRRVYDSASNSFQDWMMQMRAYLSNVWEKVKPYMLQTWDVINNERGKWQIGRVYHGTMDFIDKFSTDFVGRTNGTMFGHGLYFSDLKSIAEWYAKNAPRWRGVKAYARFGKVHINNTDKFSEYLEANDKIEDIISFIKYQDILSAKKKANELLTLYNRRRDEVINRAYKSGLKPVQSIIDSVDNIIYTAKNIIESLETGDYEVGPTKYIYNVALGKGKEEGLELLDWYEDIPKNQQDMIAAQLDKEFGDTNTMWVDNTVRGLPTSTGQRFYQYLSNHLKSAKKASELLKRAGIDGNVYPVDTGGNTKSRTYKIYKVENVVDDAARFRIQHEVSSMGKGFEMSAYTKRAITVLNDELNMYNRRILEYETEKFEGYEKEVLEAKETIDELLSTRDILVDIMTNPTKITVKEETGKRDLKNNYVIFDDADVDIEGHITLGFLGLQGAYEMLTKMYNQWKQRRTWHRDREERYVASDQKDHTIHYVKDKDISGAWTWFMHAMMPAHKGFSDLARKIVVHIGQAKLLTNHLMEIEREFIEKNVASKLDKKQRRDAQTLGLAVERYSRIKRKEFEDLKMSPADIDIQTKAAVAAYISGYQEADQTTKDVYQFARTEFFEKMRKKYIDHMIRQEHYNLSAKYKPVIDGIDAGIPPMQVLKQLGITKGAEVRKALAEYKTYKENINSIRNWGTEDYWTHMMIGDIIITEKMGKSRSKEGGVIGAAPDINLAMERAKTYIEGKVARGEKIGDISIREGFAYQGDMKTMLSKRKYILVASRLDKAIEKALKGGGQTAGVKAEARRILRKNLKDIVGIKPSLVFAAPTMETKNLLMGEDDIVDAMSMYAYAMHKKMAFDPIIDELKTAQDKLGDNEYTHIESVLDDAKGKYYLEDRILDATISTLTGGAIDAHRAASKGIDKLRNMTVMAKLGYRPIAGLLNGADAYSRIAMQLGVRYLGRAQKLLLSNTPEKRLVDKWSWALGARAFEQGGTISGGVRVGSHVLKGGKQLVTPLGMFNLMELPARRANFLAAYLYSQDMSPGLSEREHADFATLSVWTLQGANLVSMMPRIMRSPTGRLLTLFQPFVARTVEWMIMNASSPAFWAKFLGYTAAVAGPRGLIAMAKTLPLIAFAASAMGGGDWWDELEEYLQRKFGGAASGVPGAAAGVDVVGPATIQLPSVEKDILSPLGPVVSSIHELYNIAMAFNPAETVANRPQIAKAHLKKAVPAIRNIWDVIDSYYDKEGFVYNEKGDPVYNLDSKYDKALVAFGAKPVSKSYMETLSRIETKAQEIERKHVSQILSEYSNEVRKLTNDDYRNIREDDPRIESAWNRMQEKIAEYRISPESLESAASRFAKKPGVRLLLRTRQTRQAETLEKLEEAGPMFGVDFLQ